MSKYGFKDDGHEYYKDGKSDSLVSVTTLVHKYGSNFNEQYWSMYKAYEEILYGHISNKDERKKMFKALRKKIGFKLNILKELDKLNHIVDKQKAIEKAEEIKKRWKKENKKSTVKGTKYHEYHENKAKVDGVVVNPFTGEEFPFIENFKTVDKIKESIVDLDNLEDGFYSELIVEYKGIIGQIDRVWIKNKSFWIRDFKSNKEIKQSNPFQKMKYPVDHLDNCNFNDYRLQLNIYAWILTNHGYMCEGLAIDHYNKEYLIDVDYGLVDKLITDYKIKEQL